MKNQDAFAEHFLTLHKLLGVLNKILGVKSHDTENYTCLKPDVLGEREERECLEVFGPQCITLGHVAV